MTPNPAPVTTSDADLIALADECGASTISTNMAGETLVKFRIGELREFMARAALPIDFKQATDQGGAALPAGWKLTLVGERYVLQKPGEGSGVFDPEDSSVRVAVAAMFFRDLLAAAPTLQGVADGDAVGGKSGGRL